MKHKLLLSILAMTTAFASTAVQARGVVGEVELKPYVYGTVGAAQDGYQTHNGAFNDRDTRVTGQIGAGLQLSEHMGGEIYYEGGDKFKYKNETSRRKINAQTVGVRATIGTSTANKARVFAKVGVAAVRHEIGEQEATRPQFTAGVGATYAVSDNFAVRGDYDHKFKRSSDVDRKGADYVGVGGQVNF